MTDSGEFEVEISYHALERWHRRIRPDLTFAEAANDLCLRLSTEAAVSTSPRSGWPWPGRLAGAT